MADPDISGQRMRAENARTRPIRYLKLLNSTGQTIDFAAAVLSRSRFRCGSRLAPSLGGGSGLLLSRLLLARIRHHLQNRNSILRPQKQRKIAKYKNSDTGKSRDEEQTPGNLPWISTVLRRDLGFGTASFSLGQCFVRQRVGIEEI